MTNILLRQEIIYQHCSSLITTQESKWYSHDEIQNIIMTKFKDSIYLPFNYNKGDVKIKKLEIQPFSTINYLPQ
jgi:hypothetical protein